MTEIRYGTMRQPRWIAMAAASSVLVVDHAIDEERASDLWLSLHDSGGAKAVLDALTRGGISSTPDFVFAALPPGFGSTPASVTIIVRGQLSVSVHTATETLSLDGAGVSTWIERIVPDAISLELGTRDAPGRTKNVMTDFIMNDGSAPISWLFAGAHASVELKIVDPMLAPSPKVSPVVAIPDPIHAPRVAAPSEQAVDPGVTISGATISEPPRAPVEDSGYDFLFGETVMRTVEDAAVRDGVSPQAAGDHDGRTAVGLTAAERKAARQARNKPVSVSAPESQKFFLQFSTGEREILDQTFIIGRAPSASKVSANSIPRLMTVGGPDQDISRNHVQVSVEGGTVLITDLHSRNGTVVTLPGRPPQQLRGGQPTAVIAGALVDLGSGVSFTVGEN